MMSRTLSCAPATLLIPETITSPAPELTRSDGAPLPVAEFFAEEPLPKAVVAAPTTATEESLPKVDTAAPATTTEESKPTVVAAPATATEESKPDEPLCRCNTLPILPPTTEEPKADASTAEVSTTEQPKEEQPKEEQPKATKRSASDGCDDEKDDEPCAKRTCSG